MKQLLVAMACSIICLNAFAQGYIPPSPDAQGMLKYANTPVNYYTGTPGIGFPITQVSGKEISIPISLGYNASGIKVQEVAGSVGLGWSLSAGGSITRIVRGLPDEVADGYCGSNHRGYSASANNQVNGTYLNNVASGTWDGEPDLFYFNFAGRSGKFILDAAGQAVMVPYQDLSIKPGICTSGNGEWEIIDENGYHYKFGGNAMAKEISYSRQAYQSTAQQISYVSAWHLTEMANPNRTDIISLSYISSSVSYTSYLFTKIEDTDPCSPGIVYQKDESTLITVNTKYVNSITSSLGYANFEWQGGRQDVDGGVMLKSVTTYNTNGQLITKNKFSYGYFQSNGCTTNLCKRLRLEKIYDLAPDPILSFTYNTTVNLPSRDSKNFDHWGFYNANTVDSWMAATEKFTGASRTADATNSLANILIEISYRGGASKTFLFESHTGYAPTNYSAVIPIGGARIKSIATNDGNGSTITQQFNYVKENNTSSGAAYFVPDYDVFVGEVCDPSRHNCTGRYIKEAYRRYSSSSTNLFDVNGTHVGYSRVEEVISGSGKTVFYFSDIISNPDITPTRGNRLTPTSSKDWERGNLKELKVYDSNGNLLSRQQNDYNTNLSEIRSIKGWDVTSTGYQCNAPGRYGAGSYNIVSKPFVLTKTTTETYEPGNVNKKVSQVTEYEYDNETHQLIKTSSYDPLKSSVKYINKNKFVTNEDYNYQGTDCDAIYQQCMQTCDAEPDSQVQGACYQGCPTNYSNCLNANIASLSPESGAIVELKKRHQTYAPVESLSLLQSGSSVKVLSSSINIYNVEGPSNAYVQLKESWAGNTLTEQNDYVPSKIMTDGIFQFDRDRMRKAGTNTYHPVNGNIIQKNTFNGIQTNYAWDPANKYIYTSWTSGGENSRTTSNTQKLLVGPLSTTDPNGRVTTREYDAYNRLSIVKDHDGNIIGRTRYHYKGETPGFVISPSQTEVLPTENVTFYITDIAASVGGTPQFVWDFGDGTVIDNGSTTVSHAYAAAGNYTVKLVGMNPEYGAATRQVVINVRQPMSASICENGPTIADLCGVTQPQYGGCTTSMYQNSNAPVELTATVVNGCSSSYSYSWSYQKAGNQNVTTLGTGPVALVNVPNSEGTYIYACTITDGCGHQTTVSSYIERNKSNSDPNGNCNGGPQN